MKKKAYQSMDAKYDISRRDFIKIGGALGTGIILGTPAIWAQEQTKEEKPPRIKTNIDDAMKAKKTKYSLPGLYPGKVVEVHHKDAMKDNKPNAKIINKIFAKGIEQLTGKNLKDSSELFFTKA